MTYKFIQEELKEIKQSLKSKSVAPLKKILLRYRVKELESLKVFAKFWYTCPRDHGALDLVLPFEEIHDDIEHLYNPSQLKMNKKKVTINKFLKEIGIRKMVVEYLQDIFCYSPEEADSLISNFFRYLIHEILIQAKEQIPLRTVMQRWMKRFPPVRKEQELLSDEEEEESEEEESDEEMESECDDSD